MPFAYDIPPSSGALRQGELLANVWVHRVDHSAISIPKGSVPEVESEVHPLVIVMTAECDLYQDFAARLPQQQAQEAHRPDMEDRSRTYLIPHVLLCDMYEEGRIKVQVPAGSQIWKRIIQNQDERYHHLQAAPVGDPSCTELPALFLDFKKTFSLPTQSLCDGVSDVAVERLAVVPPVYIHDLMHRFYGFLSRVGLPE